MGDATNIVAHEATPTDLGVIALEHLIELLDAAAEQGFEEYLPIWQAGMAGARASVTLCWDGLWPHLLTGTTDDGDPREVLAERFRYRDALMDHIRAQGMRADLIRHLIGDREGTNPDAEDYEVGRETAIVVRDFIAAGGRILIDPQDRLTEGAGVPHDFGRGDDARDAEIMRASAAYFMAALCPRAVPGIRLIVEGFGEQTANGWTELRARDIPLEDAFAGWKTALAAIRASGIDADDSAYWARFDFAEEVICSSSETGLRAAEIQLWMALREILNDREYGNEILCGDLASLRGRLPRLDPEAGYVIRAVAALRGEAAHG